MKIEDFLIERYKELIANAKSVQEAHPRFNLPSWPRTYFPSWTVDVINMANSMLKIVEWHKNWPVLVETEPEITPIKDFDPSGINQYTMQFSQKLSWFTQEEYVKKFGREPATAPLLLDMVQQFKDHPDFDQAWSK